MSKLCSKLGTAIRRSDVFGAPVQLKYKGKKAFNTLFGGCLSLILIIGLIVYFAYMLHGEYYHPRFFTTPTTYDLKQKTAYLYPELGNTVALALNPLSATEE